MPDTFLEHISAATRGAEWESLEWEVFIVLLTDGEYSAAIEDATPIGPGGTVRNLEQHRPLVQAVLDDMADRNFYGRKTLGWAMDRIMKRLRLNGIDMPVCWVPIAKILWRGGPAIMDLEGVLWKKHMRGRILL